MNKNKLQYLIGKGKTKSPKNVSSEHNNQSSFVGYVKENYPILEIVAIPNAGKRSGREGWRMKAEGLSTGFPDIEILFPVDFAPPLFIENKKENKRNHKLPESQDLKHKLLRDLGYTVSVCYTYEEQVECLEDYIKTHNQKGKNVLWVNNDNITTNKENQ